MPSLRRYDIFISHCWDYDANYYRVVEWLDEPGQRFRWKNLSVTEASPMREDKRFEARLRKKLSQADIMVVIVGMEIAHRYWMEWEIRWARIRSVPIIGLMPYGLQQVPNVVQDAGCPIVGWRRDSLVRAIRQYSR